MRLSGLLSPSVPDSPEVLADELKEIDNRKSSAGSVRGATSLRDVRWLETRMGALVHWKDPFLRVGARG
jgi:hypothetical protein